jgi:two-component system, NarL family, response regulator NreC
MSDIRVVVVDDHPVVRGGVRWMLDDADGIEVVGEASGADEALEVVEGESPDVVVLDLTMPGVHGMELVTRIARGKTRSRVLVLTVHEGAGWVREALAAGASGYVTKDAVARDLVEAVRAVAVGTLFVTPSLGALLVGEAFDAKDEVQLTDREREVLVLLARGFTNKEAADRLFVSVRTIEGHRANVFRKLGITSRAELVEYAIERGLLAGG